MPKPTVGVVAAVQLDALTVAGTVIVDVAALAGRSTGSKEEPGAHRTRRARTGAAMRTTDFNVNPSGSGSR